jgi:hypothetical protein
MATRCILVDHTSSPRHVQLLKEVEMAKKHKVQFNAHRRVREEVPVSFRTRDGEKVSFDAKKKVRQPVRVRFMAKD